MFLADGRQCEFVAATDAGIVVKLGYRDEDSEDEDDFYYDTPSLQKRVFAKAPVELIEPKIAELLKAEADARTRLADINRELREKEKSRADFLKKIGDFTGLRNFEMVLNGTITHFVFKSYSGIFIKTKDEALDQNDTLDRKKLRLLTLFGSTAGNLQWRINRWSDGSGTDEDAWPCESLEVARAKEHLEQAERVRYTGTPRKSWRDAVFTWAGNLPENLKASTVKRYKVSLRNVGIAHLGKPIERTFAELFVDEVDRKVLGLLVAARRATGITNRTIKRDLSAISSVLDVAVANQWVDENACDSFSRKAIKEKKKIIVLPEEADIDFVVAAAPGTFANMIRAAQYTGMREEELASLQRPQVRQGAIDLSRTKTSRPRSVPLDSRAVGTVSGTPAHLTCPFVFWHTRKMEGKPEEVDRYHNVSSQFGRIMAQAQERATKAKRRFRRFRFHDLRHWFAVDYLRQGGSIYDLQRILGHTSIRTTELYLDFLTPEEAKQSKYGLAQNPAQG